MGTAASLYDCVARLLDRVVEDMANCVTTCRCADSDDEATTSISAHSDCV